MRGKRITIFVGEFGSGKTELAVNYALQLKEKGIATAIVDMDLVKPYFRIRENRELLEKNGIRVIAPEPRLAQADLPVLPHNIVSVLSQTDIHVVIDVGGGESAIVLGQLNRYLSQDAYQALLVINTKRPFTNDVQSIIHILKRIEQVSRLKISGMVNNTNLGPETTAEHVYQGQVIVEAAARQLSLPVTWAVVPEWLETSVQSNIPLFVMKPYTQYPWMME